MLGVRGDEERRGIIQVILRALILCGGLGLSPAVLAADAAAPVPDLIVAVRATPDSMDPYHHNLTPNYQAAIHMFEPLVRLDEGQRLQPALATSWRVIDPVTWEFKLRQGVRFHDGSTFGAEDVLATWERVPLSNGPSSFTVFTEPVERIEVVDRYTLRLITREPFPVLPNYLSQVVIIPAELKAAPTEDFNSGTAMIGTGPYRYVEWQPEEYLKLEVNPAYWGEVPEWETVEFRFMPDDARRIAALVSGEVDLVDAVSPYDMQWLSQAADVTLVSAPSNRVIYLSVDFDRPQTPFAHDHEGKPLPHNPFQNPRVREAISLAIDREALITEVLGGEGYATGELVPPSFFGADPGRPVPQPDVSGARDLLAEAGYPDGFVTVLHGPNNRYVRDAAVADAVALMLSGAGIATTTDTMPASEFFPRNRDRQFSFTLRGWSTETGEAGFAIRALMQTRNVEAGHGTANHNRYSSPDLDAVITEANRTLDTEKRERLLRQAMDIGMREHGQIPLYFQKNNWAMRKGLTYVGRTDELTLIPQVRTAPPAAAGDGQAHSARAR